MNSITVSKLTKKFKEKVFKCNEDDYIWSYRENTDEQLVLVLVDEANKCFCFPNSEYANTLLQMQAGLELAKKGYEWFTSDKLDEF